MYPSHVTVAAWWSSWSALYATVPAIDCASQLPIHRLNITTSSEWL
jgi:hypothetical protein